MQAKGAAVAWSGQERDSPTLWQPRRSHTAPPSTTVRTPAPATLARSPPHPLELLRSRMQPRYATRNSSSNRSSKLAATTSERLTTPKGCLISSAIPAHHEGTKPLFRQIRDAMRGPRKGLSPGETLERMTRFELATLTLARCDGACITCCCVHARLPCPGFRS
jgi:hypothetical protein